MKRFFAMIVVWAVLLCAVPFSAHATENNTTITHFLDGSYLVTDIQVSNTRMLTKVGSKTDTYYSSDNVAQWKMVITAEFLYDGTTCTCTYASGITTIYNTSSWQKVFDRASYSGSSATYTTRFNYSTLGIVVNSYEYSAVLTCDKNGNIS